MTDGPTLPKAYLLTALVTIFALVPELISSTAAPHIQRTIEHTFLATSRTPTWIAQRDPTGVDQRVDAGALIYTIVGVGGVFFGVGQLATGAGVGAPIVVVPLTVGLVALAVLLVTEFRVEEPLLPVKALSTALPLMGTITAMVAGAAYVAMLQLSSTFLTAVPALTPLQNGLAVWPNVVTTAVGGALFVVFLHTRWASALIMAGLGVLALGAYLLQGLTVTAGFDDVAIRSVIVGLGAGLTVAPGRLIASFSARLPLIGRAIALVELFHLSATYLGAPVLLRVVAVSVGRYYGTRARVALARVTGTVRTFVQSGAAPGLTPAQRALLRRATVMAIHDAFIVLCYLLLLGMLLIAGGFRAQPHAVDRAGFRPVSEGQRTGLRLAAGHPGGLSVTRCASDCAG